MLNYKGPCTSASNALTFNRYVTSLDLRVPVRAGSLGCSRQIVGLTKGGIKRKLRCLLNRIRGKIVPGRPSTLCSTLSRGLHHPIRG